MPTERPSTVAAKRDAHGSQAARSLSEAMRLPRPISLFSVVQARIKVGFSRITTPATALPHRKHGPDRRPRMLLAPSETWQFDLMNVANGGDVGTDRR